MQIMVIGQAQHQVVFQHCRCPDKKWVRYTNQESSWVDIALCQEWFDTVIVPAVLASCTESVCLIWDNCSGHRLVNNHPDIEIRLLQPNVTSRYQQLDCCISVSVKLRYKLDLTVQLVEVMDNRDLALAQSKWVKYCHGCLGLKHGSCPNVLDVCQTDDPSGRISILTLLPSVDSTLPSFCCSTRRIFTISSMTMQGNNHCQWFPRTT